VKTGVKTQSSGAVDVATRREGVTSNATAASSHDTSANRLDGVEGAEVEVSNNCSNLRSKEKGLIATSRNMVDVEALVGPTRRGVRQFDSRDKTTAIRGGHPARDNLGARSRGRGTRRGGNRVTHRESSPVAKGQGSHQRRRRGGSIHQPEGEANNLSETVKPPVARARRATEGKNNTERPKAKQHHREQSQRLCKLSRGWQIDIIGRMRK